MNAEQPILELISLLDGLEENSDPSQLLQELNVRLELLIVRHRFEEKCAVIDRTIVSS